VSSWRHTNITPTAFAPIKMRLLCYSWVVLVIPKVSSLVSPSRSTTCRRSTPRCSATTNADHDDKKINMASVYSPTNQPHPYFQVKPIPTALWITSRLTESASSRLDQVVNCAEYGECSVEDMTAMIDGTYLYVRAKLMN
jgi:hypothetical protein